MTLLTLLLLSQAQVQINIPLPIIRFEAPPPLVVVEPGVQVVPDYDDEVFVVDSWYWVRRDGRWFRSRDHRGGWAVVDAPGVPPVLVKVPHGKYRRFKHAVKAEIREERREEREERREEKREEKQEKREKKKGK